MRREEDAHTPLAGQPAEELGDGARKMLDAGLFKRFAKPDFALAVHNSSTAAAGTVEALLTLAGQAPPFASLIDPDAAEFLHAGDMPARIRSFCTRTGQPDAHDRSRLIRRRGSAAGPMTRSSAP